MDRVLLTLYSLLMWLAQPLLRRKMAKRARQEPGYGMAIDERFGRYRQPAEQQAELVWVHAVSLGETRTAGILLTALRQAQPGLRLLLTHGTATGRAAGQSLLRSGDMQVWQPWDSRAAVARFLNHFKPRLGLLMETEIWPALLAAAQQRHVPMVLVNARLSQKSLAQALRVSPLALPAYGALAVVLAQTPADAARFAELGVNAHVVGNLKFDAAPDPEQLTRGAAWRRAVQAPVVLFASSREGEENGFFEKIAALVQTSTARVAINSGVTGGDDVLAAKPRAQQALRLTQVTPVTQGMPVMRVARVLIVPRHPQRFDEVAALAAQHGLLVSRRSQWPDAGPAASPEAMAADIWLGDSLGEMALYYALADAALLGGSFAPLGGQNLIEAAACACPVVMGPHTFNFAEAADQADAAGAAQRVPDMAHAVAASFALINNNAARQLASTAGIAFAARNQGATERTVRALQPFLGVSSPASLQGKSETLAA